jgi:hypothetical protein
MQKGFIMKNAIVNARLKKPQKKETKWGEFARKMDGLFTPEIIEHLEKNRKEAREKL